MTTNMPQRTARSTVAAGAALAVLLGLLLIGPVAPAAAGGWAVGSLDAVPAPRAGETVEVGFTILQHGVTPAQVVEDVGIEIVGADGVPDFFPAERGERVGHYIAPVTFPTEAGDYGWSIRMGWFGWQELGTVTVTSGDAPSAASDTWSAVRWTTAALGAVLALIAVWSLAASRRSPQAAAT